MDDIIPIRAFQDCFVENAIYVFRTKIYISPAIQGVVKG